MSRSAVVSFGSNYIMRLDEKPWALAWTSRLAIDADGHPMCYHPSGSPPGLDYLANAGSPGNWWGIATNGKGLPYIQTVNDEAPGFYVSNTALENIVLAISDPLRYVNSAKVPFLVLPLKPQFHKAQQLGDVAMMFNNKTGMQTWAVYADIGPSNQIGEGSMRLAELLGLSNDPKRGGTSEEVIATIYFPGSALGPWPQLHEDLAAEAYRLFDHWGGFASAKLILPQIEWDQFEPVTAPLEPSPSPSEPPVVTITIDVPAGVKVNVVQKELV
jgi:hypothetical protein